MQKNAQVTNLPYLILHATYDGIQVGLFGDLFEPVLQFVQKFQASKCLIPTISRILASRDNTFHNLRFIGLSRGPAPFTTLRTLMTTANGIAFATGIPLVAIDGLLLLYQTAATKASTPPIIVLNAFNNEVYYAYAHQKTIKTGVAPAQELFNMIDQDLPDSHLMMVGNGVSLLQEYITEQGAHRIFIGNPALGELTIETIAHECVNSFNQGIITTQAMPLYLKPAVSKRIKKMNV